MFFHCQNICHYSFYYYSIISLTFPHTLIQVYKYCLYISVFQVCVCKHLISPRRINEVCRLLHLFYLYIFCISCSYMYFTVSKDHTDSWAHSVQLCDRTSGDGPLKTCTATKQMWLKCAVPPDRIRTPEHTWYLSDSSLAAVEEVLEPCEADSGSASSSLLCFRGEVAAGALGSLNFTAWTQESGLLPVATELLGGGFIWAVRPAEGASSSESELTSWWVYWWISFSLRIIWRFGKGRTPNLHRGESKLERLRNRWTGGKQPEIENRARQSKMTAREVIG